MAEDKLTDHEYDGIREYDNPTPTWWNLIFLGTFVFSVLYFIYFHLGTGGWTLAEAHQTAVSRNLKLRFGEIGELTGDRETLLDYMSDPDKKKWLSMGATTFAVHCQACHAPDGRGSIGPNLTDDHYKNVKKLTDIVEVIQNGAAAGSMPAWRDRLHPNEIVLTAAYVANMRGKNLAGPRGPEGQEIPPWPEAGAEASEKPAGEGAPPEDDNPDAEAPSAEATSNE